MFSQFIQRTIQFLSGGPYRLLLKRQSDPLNHQIILECHKGRKPLPLDRVIRKFPPVAELEKLLSPRANQNDAFTVPLNALSQVKALLARFAYLDLEIHIASEVSQLEPSAIPEQFEILYFWNLDNECLQRQMWPETDYFGGGWFANQETYWQVEKTTEEDDRWLGREKISGQGILHFLTSISPAWKKKLLPYRSYLSYNTSPAVSFNIVTVLHNTVELQINWHVDARFIRPIATIESHILIFDEIRPGVYPKSLPFGTQYTSSGLNLHDEEIPFFLDNTWPSIQLFTQGAKDTFLKLHRIIQGQTTLKLIAEPRQERGIGRPVIIPTFTCGSLSMPGQDVSALLAKNQTYYRINTGWLPASLIQQAGILPDNHTRSGLDLNPVPLTPLEIIRRQSRLIKLPVEIPVTGLPQADKAVDAAAQHLQFLREWGIPGGIIGTPSHYSTALRKLVASIISDYSPARILVLGSPEALSSLTSLATWKQLITAQFDGGKQDPSFHNKLRGIVFATPKALDRHPALLKTEWELLLLLGADELIKSNRSNLFRQLTACPRLLCLALFQNDLFLQKSVVKEALSQVLGLPAHEAAFLWRYIVRDPQQEPPPLPTPLGNAFPQPTSVPKPSLSFAEYQVGSSQDRGLSIPSRPTQTPTRPATQEPGITIRSISRDEIFVREARKWVNHTEKKSPFAPFQQYWPTYQVLGVEQKRWYFYWRSEVRQKRYPKTDLSYIFLHAYELIHQIGARTQNDGFQQLSLLWINYRRAFPQLDLYLPDWIADYAFVYRCSVAPLKIYSVLASDPGPSIASRHLDLILANYIDQPLTTIPLALLDKLATYELQKSRFYLDGHQELVAKWVPATLDHVNQAYIKQSGRGIFARYHPNRTVSVKRRLFQSALYDGSKDEIVLANVAPYSQHTPLRLFLTRVVKYTENQLRELKNYNGRLRDETLDLETQTLINAYVKRVASSIVPQPSGPKVVIDQVEINRLRQESDELFQLLVLTEESNVATGSADLMRQRTQVFPDQAAIMPVVAVGHTREPERLVEAEPVVVEPLPAPVHPRLELDNALLARASRETEALFEMIHSSEEASEVIVASEGEVVAVSTSGSNEPETEAGTAYQGRDEKSFPANNGLSAEWQGFAYQLADYHYAIIEALLFQRNPLTTIRTIAEARITMPEPLLDEINEIAQETIGDIIILTDASSPVLVEDYIAELKTLLQRTG